MARNALPPARRPSELALDSLVGAGPDADRVGSRVDADRPKAEADSGTSGTSGTSGFQYSSGAAGSLGTSGSSGTTGTRSVLDTSVTLGQRRSDSPSSLTDLEAPGTLGTFVPVVASDPTVASVRNRVDTGRSTEFAEDLSVVPTNLATSAPPGILGNSDTLIISGTSGTSDTSYASDRSTTSSTKSTDFELRDSKLSPREHVKIARPLADEMRDAVWFFSDNGRPRVRLGDLLDEAIRSWLEMSKQVHNDGGNFPVRGRLR